MSRLLCFGKQVLRLADAEAERRRAEEASGWGPLGSSGIQGFRVEGYFGCRVQDVGLGV